MKKKFILFFLALLVFSFIFCFADNLATAQISDFGEGVEEKIDELEQGIEKAEDIADNPKVAAEEYLRQEWTKILERNQFGRFLLGVSKILNALNPAFKFFLGVEYSLSWLFFLSLTAGIFIFVVIYLAIANVMQWKAWISMAISLIILALAAQYDTIEMFVMFFVPLFKNWLINLLMIFLSFVILSFYYKFMNKFGKTVEAHMEEEKKAGREQKASLVERINDIFLKSHGHK